MLRKIALGLTCMLFVSVMEAQAQPRARITASTMDSNGNVFVTGWRVLAAGGWDIVTIKYDRNGNMQWSHSYPSDTGTAAGEGWGIAVDPSGNVYVAGHVEAVAADIVDCLLIKYPHDYEQGDAPEWVRTYDGGGYDQNWTIAVDSDGYIYVTGYSQQDHMGFLNSDIVTMKYNSKGDMVWGTPRFYNGPANLWENAFAIVVDPVTKNVYVTGSSRNDAAATSHDIITVMYDSDGTEKWARRYSGPVNGNNKGTSLALDAEGSVYVAGWSQGTGSIDYATIKYDVAGNERWVARYDGPAGGNDQPAPPAGGPMGSSTYSYVQNNQGIIVTTEVLDPVPEVQYLIGMVSGLNLNRGIQVSLLAKLNACLESLLADNADARENAHHVLGAFINQLQSLAVENLITNEKAGELIAVANQIIKGILGIETTVVYVAGQSTGAGTNVDFAVVKYNAADGSPMWNLPGQPGTTSAKPGNPPNIALRYNGLANNIDRAWAMAMDFDGNIYVTGPSMEASAKGVDYFTIKYFVNTYHPLALGEGRYNGPKNTTDQPCGFATWRDPASGRHYIFRDSTTNADYVCVTGNSAELGAPTYRYAALMYDDRFNLLWFQTFY